MLLPLPKYEHDPSEDDGVNVVLLGGAVLFLLLIAGGMYLLYRLLRALIQRR